MFLTRFSGKNVIETLTDFHEISYYETINECLVARVKFKTLKTQLNPICHLLALVGAHHILHVSGVRVK